MKNTSLTYRVIAVYNDQVTFRHCTDSQVTYSLKHFTLPVLHCEYSPDRKIWLGSNLNPFADNLALGQIIGFVCAERENKQFLLYPQCFNLPSASRP